MHLLEDVFGHLGVLMGALALWMRKMISLEMGEIGGSGRLGLSKNLELPQHDSNCVLRC